MLPREDKPNGIQDKKQPERTSIKQKKKSTSTNSAHESTASTEAVKQHKSTKEKVAKIKTPKITKIQKTARKRKGDENKVEQPLTAPVVHALKPAVVDQKHKRMFGYEFQRDNWNNIPINTIGKPTTATLTKSGLPRKTVTRGGLNGMKSMCMKPTWRSERKLLPAHEQKQLNDLAFDSPYFYPLLPLYCISRQLLQSQHVEIFFESPSQPLMVRVFHGTKGCFYLVQEVLLIPLQQTIRSNENPFLYL